MPQSPAGALAWGQRARAVQPSRINGLISPNNNPCLPAGALARGQRAGAAQPPGLLWPARRHRHPAAAHAEWRAGGALAGALLAGGVCADSYCVMCSGDLYRLRLPPRCAWRWRPPSSRGRTCWCWTSPATTWTCRCRGGPCALSWWPAVCCLCRQHVAAVLGMLLPVQDRAGGASGAGCGLLLEARVLSWCWTSPATARTCGPAMPEASLPATRSDMVAIPPAGNRLPPGCPRGLHRRRAAGVARPAPGAGKAPLVLGRRRKGSGVQRVHHGA